MNICKILPFCVLLFLQQSWVLIMIKCNRLFQIPNPRKYNSLKSSQWTECIDFNEIQNLDLRIWDLKESTVLLFILTKAIMSNVCSRLGVIMCIARNNNNFDERYIRSYWHGTIEQAFAPCYSARFLYKKSLIQTHSTPFPTLVTQKRNMQPNRWQHPTISPPTRKASQKIAKRAQSNV